MSEEIDEFLCNVCMNYYTLPIFECENKHSICYKCYGKVEQCPMCRGVYDKLPKRSRALELKLARAKLPCPNNPEKCTNLIFYSELKEHNHRCHYAVIRCPTFCGVCTRTGLRKDILEHITENHGFHLINGTHTTIDVSSMAGILPFGLAFYCFNTIFLVKYVMMRCPMDKSVVAFYIRPTEEFEIEKYLIRIESTNIETKTKKFTKTSDGLYLDVDSSSILNLTIAKTYDS